MFGETTISYVKIRNHPIETTIYSLELKNNDILSSFFFFRWLGCFASATPQIFSRLRGTFPEKLTWQAGKSPKNLFK